MSKSDTNSCKKGCSCTSCKDSHNDLEEKFTDGVWNKVKRFAKSIKSPETRYRDFQDKVHGSSHWNPARGKAVRKGGDIAVSKGIDPGYYPWDKRPKFLKIFEDTKKESSMSNPDIHGTFMHFIDSLKGHKSPFVNKHGNDAKLALERGDYTLAKNSIDAGHTMSRQFDRIHTAAGLLKKSKDENAVSHATDALLHLHTGNIDKAQKHLDVATMYHNREIQESKEVDLNNLAPLTKVGATKTGEKLVPEKRKAASIKANYTPGIQAGKSGEEYMKKDKYTELAEAAFGSLNKSNPFRGAPLNEEAPTFNVRNIETNQIVGTHQHGRGFIPSRPNSGLKPSPTIPDGHKIDRSNPKDSMRLNKIKPSKETSFGSLNKSNSFRSVPLELEEAKKVPHPHIKKLMDKVGEHFEDIGLPRGKTKYTGIHNGSHTFEHQLPEDDFGDVTTHNYRVELGDMPRAIHTGTWTEDAEGTRQGSKNPKHNVSFNPNFNIDEEVEHLDEVSDEKMEKVARLRVAATKSNLDGNRVAPDKLEKYRRDFNKQMKSIDAMGPKRWAAARDRGINTELGIKKEEFEQMDEGDVIQFPSKPKPTSTKPSKVITTATRRPAGPRPVKENLNQRFPDVERDITAIMKESYKRAKLKEDAMNIHIATPEQRNDWLDVSKGAMDVVDYINKYKV